MDDATSSYLVALDRIANAIGTLQYLSVNSVQGHNKAVKDMLEVIEKFKEKAKS